MNLNELETNILGVPVVELQDLTGADVASIDREIAAAHPSAYAVCRVAVEEIATIQTLEGFGFRYIETQLRLTFSLRKEFDTSMSQYVFERVATQDALEEALAVARVAFSDDRWFIDPDLPNAASLSSARYEAYVRQSFARNDERLYRLLDPATGRTVAIKTHRLLGGGKALALLGGVHPDYRDGGVAPVAAFHEYNQLIRDGVRHLTTHVSARNYGVINLEVRSLNYRVAQTFVVLRKLYEESRA